MGLDGKAWWGADRPGFLSVWPRGSPATSIPETRSSMLLSAVLGLTEKAARFEPAATREKVLAAEQFNWSRIRRYLLRPFDLQWCYYSAVRPMWNEPRPTLWRQHQSGARFLLSRLKASRRPEGPPFLVTNHLFDDHVLAPDAGGFADQVWVGREQESEQQLPGLQSASTQLIPNLSEKTLGFANSIGSSGGEPNTLSTMVWNHVVAIGYSPEYLTQNGDALRLDWPRIPLPNNRELLLASAELGREVADLLDPETDVVGVTAGVIRPEMKVIGVATRVGGGNLDPQVGDLAVTAGWGHAGKRGVTMPGKGKSILRPYTPEERAAVERS